MGSSFKSNDISITDILKDIDNGIVQLPDFQRGWVWDDYRIKSLIASISNSYPVGALMFLEYGGDAVRFKYRPFNKLKTEEKPDILVLDGQQRLTSIFSSMFFRGPVDTKTDKNKEIKRYYYLDIEKCLNSTVDRIDAIISVPENKMIRSNFGKNIQLDLSTREKEFENHMFPLNIVYDLIECGMWMNQYQEYHSYTAKIMQRYGKFNVEILNPIQTYKVPVITLDKKTPKEAVCQVFENVNTGGVSLTVFELVTAIFAADNFELRKDWEKRKEILEKESILSDVSATDFLTAITLISRYYIKQNGGEAISCKKKDVLKITLEEYQMYADRLTEGFIKSSKFLKEQRIFTSRDLPYSTQLIPMSVIFSILDNKSYDSIVKNKISRWYWCGVLGEMYGGANETRYANDVSGIMEWINNDNEPDTVQRAYFNPTRLLTLQTRLSAAYKGIMALILKAGCVDFISGSPMDFTIFIDENTDIHHIFPKSYCEGKNIKKKKWNSIVNKTPLFARTNRIIGGNSPSKYMDKIEKSDHVNKSNLDKFVSTHLINVGYLRSDNFDEYFIDRTKNILNLISIAMGKNISNLDSDEIIQEFGKSLK